MADKTFPLTINVVNGDVLEFPVQMFFNGGLLVPVGETIVRYFDADMCSVAHKTFYLRYGSDLFGTNQFKSNRDYNQFLGAMQRINLLIDGCNMQFEGVDLVF